MASFTKFLFALTTLCLLSYAENDCSYVMNPNITYCFDSDTDTDSDDQMCYKWEMEGAIPLYYCISSVDDGDANSVYFICSLTGDGIVALQFDEEGCDGSFNGFYEVETDEYYCSENEDFGKCDIFHVKTSNLESGDTECALDHNNYRSQMWLNNVCFPRRNDEGGSAKPSCNESSDYRQYTLYNSDDCSGEANYTYNVQDGDCVDSGDGDGNSSLTWVDIQDCGLTKRQWPGVADCSYVENAVAYIGDLDYSDGYYDVNIDGAVPMFPSLDEAVCFGQVNSMDGSRSFKIVCNAFLQFGFIAVYDGTFCDGDFTSYAIHDYDEFDCGYEACPYVHIRTSKSNDCSLNDTDYSEEIWITDHCMSRERCDWDSDDSECDYSTETRLVSCDESDDTVIYQSFTGEGCKPGNIEIDVSPESETCLTAEDTGESGDLLRFVELLECQQPATTSSPGNGDGVYAVMWGLSAVLGCLVALFGN